MIPAADLTLIEGIVPAALDTPPAIFPVAGAARIAALNAAFYRPTFGAAAREASARFRLTASLAARIEVRRFVRPRDKAAVAHGVGLLAADLGANIRTAA